MNANAKKWVAALRSDRFTQGKHALCEDDRFCCLGVACELALEEGIVKREMDGDYATYGDEPISFQELILPEIVQRWLGLSTPSGSFNGDRLIDLNDKQNKTFAEIADIIESEPPGLFV